MHRLTRASLFFLVLALGCASAYEKAQKVDTVEAYEQFIKENPASTDVGAAHRRVAELKLAEAKKVGTLEAYDKFIAEFPRGKSYEEAMELRKPMVVAAAEKADTAEAWEQVIKEYGTIDGRLRARAIRESAAAREGAVLLLGEVKTEQVNFDGDPKGALDGWQVSAPVTNKGTQSAENVQITLHFRDAAGVDVDSRRWPLVAPHLPQMLPMPKGFDVPLAPGETRTFAFKANSLKPGWKTVTLEIDSVKWAVPAAPAAEGAVAPTGTPAADPKSAGGAATPAGAAAPAKSGPSVLATPKPASGGK